MGPDNDGVVVMEICRVPIDDDEGCGYYQLYTTIFKELETERYPEMLVALNEINLSTVLGNYGILATHQMLYHKYVMRLPGMRRRRHCEGAPGYGLRHSGHYRQRHAEACEGDRLS